jgi:hypothetical protein
MFEKFDHLLLSYPTSTLIGSDWSFRRRQLEVVSVRDLLFEPLKPAEYLRRPLIHRGRYLVRAKDLLSRQVQQFYLASSLEFYRPTGLRLALYQPGPERAKPETFVSRRFGVSRRERIAMARAICELQTMNWEGFELRITIDRRSS